MERLEILIAEIATRNSSLATVDLDVDSMPHESIYGLSAELLFLTKYL